MIALLNFAVAGLVFGAIAAAAVELLSIRFARAASLLGTLSFPLAAVAPLVRFGAEVALPVDDRRGDALLAAICVTVAVALVAREIATHARGRRQRRNWTHASAALCRSAGVDSLYVQPDQQPATYGVFRRCVVVPSEDVAEPVLLHERAHYRWRDPLAAAVRRLIRATLWFHPGLPLLDRSTRLAAELAADRAALSGTTRSKRESFALLLVAAARSASGTTAFGARKKNDLEVRIRAILGCAPSRGRLISAFALVVALPLLPLLPHFTGHDETVIRHVIRID